MSGAAGVRLAGHQERMFGRPIWRPRLVRPGRGCSFLVRAHRAWAAWPAPASVPWPGQV
jgi:hypothetical protein